MIGAAASSNKSRNAVKQVEPETDLCMILVGCRDLESINLYFHMQRGQILRECQLLGTEVPHL